MTLPETLAVLTPRTQLVSGDTCWAIDLPTMCTLLQKEFLHVTFPLGLKLFDIDSQDPSRKVTAFQNTKA